MAVHSTGEICWALCRVRGANFAAGCPKRFAEAIVFVARTRYKFGVAEAAIRVENLEKFFSPSRSGWRALLQPFEKPTVAALAGISLEVRPGEAVALLGANGAGKSTFLRILATLLLPTRGRASIAGHDAVLDPRAVRRQLGYHAGSDQGFYTRLTGRENLQFFGRLNHLSSRAITEQIAQLSQQFDFAQALDRQVRTLSSGTVQRLSLARSLLHRPAVLLLDEPTRSLDAIAAAEFRRFLKDEILRRGDTSLLFASHTLSEIEALADRIAVIDAGRLLLCDTLSTLKRKTSATSLEEAFLRMTGRNPQQLAQEPEQ
jgi:ABC-type multidrug transport system ATPase subunit